MAPGCGRMVPPMTTPIGYQDNPITATTHEVDSTRTASSYGGTTTTAQSLHDSGTISDATSREECLTFARCRPYPSSMTSKPADFINAFCEQCTKQ